VAAVAQSAGPGCVRVQLRRTDGLGSVRTFVEGLRVDGLLTKVEADCPSAG
jgi:hypothetical protein